MRATNAVRNVAIRCAKPRLTTGTDGDRIDLSGDGDLGDFRLGNVLGRLHQSDEVIVLSKPDPIFRPCDDGLVHRRRRRHFAHLVKLDLPVFIEPGHSDLFAADLREPKAVHRTHDDIDGHTGSRLLDPLTVFGQRDDRPFGITQGANKSGRDSRFRAEEIQRRRARQRKRAAFFSHGPHPHGSVRRLLGVG